MKIGHAGWLGIATVIAFGAGFISARTVSAQEGTADQRMGVTAAMSGARLIPCPSNGQPRCFRIFVQLKSSDDRIHNLAAYKEDAQTYLTDTFAYLSAGGVCRATVDANVPRVRRYWSANRVWTELPLQPITVSAMQPFAMPVTFSCDQLVDSGDTARLQFSVVVGSNTFSDGQYEDARPVHFTWPQVAIDARTVDAGPAPLAAPGSGEVSSDSPVFGFRLSVVTDGAYISDVVAGSSAARAGLTPGMVISHINGHALKGLTNAQVDASMKASQGEVSLNIIGKGVVKLIRSRIGASY